MSVDTVHWITLALMAVSQLIQLLRLIRIENILSGRFIRKK